MKRVLAVLTAALILSGCSGVKSVDLSGVKFDGAAVGDSFSDIDTDRYTVTERFPEGEGVHNFEEWRITERKRKITDITAEFEYIEISVNGVKDCKHIEDVIALLGNDYRKKIYDDEEELSEIEYRDKKADVTCGFVYSQRDDSLVLAIMRKK